MAESHDPHAVNSLIEEGADPSAGTVRWDPVHSIWNGSMLAGALVLGPLTFSASAFAIFLLTTGAGLLLGHSVGFHRRMIHGSFECPLWLERSLAWFGTSVGMSGPFWMIRTHDLRDWAQRQPRCHDYLAHRRPMLIDAWWQMHCRLDLERAPRFDLGRIGRDPFHRFLEATWMLQQAPIALALFLIGGWSFVVWGVFARVSASVTGHWFIGHLAHRRGPQTWLVDGAGVQAHDVPWAAIPTMGEAWHNNHHAFPGSARIGLYRGQSDWGFVLIRTLERIGLAWNIQTPDTLRARKRLSPVPTFSSALPEAAGFRRHSCRSGSPPRSRGHRPRASSPAPSAPRRA
jgi:stearoyl-CoA desaturase (delta-9 desaturase)